MKQAFRRVNQEFGIYIKPVKKESRSDTQVKLTTVPNADAVNGEWIRRWDDSGVTDIYLSMTYQSGLDSSKYPDAHQNPEAFPHDKREQSTWKKIFIHELGHLLGLEHPWDKDDGDWAVSGPNVETIDTVMGYEDTDASGDQMEWFQDIDKKSLRDIWGTAASPVDGQKSTLTILTGSSKHDTLKAKKSASILYGKKGNDMLIGSNENDILLGGKGNDTLKGNAGFDAFIL